MGRQKQARSHRTTVGAITNDDRADKRKHVTTRSQHAFTPPLAAMIMGIVLCVGLILAFVMRITLPEVESQQTGNAHAHVHLVDLEQVARGTLMSDSSPEWEAAEAAFLRVLEEGERLGWPALSTHAVGSSRAHLGMISHRRKDWRACVQLFQPAMDTAEAIAGMARYLQSNSNHLPSISNHGSNHGSTQTAACSQCPVVDHTTMPLRADYRLRAVRAGTSMKTRIRSRLRRWTSRCGG